MKLALVTSWPTDISSQFKVLGCHLHSLIQVLQVSGMVCAGAFQGCRCGRENFPHLSCHRGPETLLN